MSHRDGVKKAMDGYYKKLAKKELGPQRKNQKPEKQVEKDCLEWFSSMNWSGQIYESKAKYSQSRGRYVQMGMSAGTSDWQGQTENVHPAYVEFKAPGKRSTFWNQKNKRQQDYLIDKINCGAFAVVVDSAILLHNLYESWKEKLEKYGRLYAAKWLMDQLPPRPIRRKEKINDELGF